MKKEKSEEIYAFLGPQGAMLSGSKSLYRKDNPQNIVFFNANVCFLKEKVEKSFFGILKKRSTYAQKVWWGDFDLTKNHAWLKNLAYATGETVILLQEMDGRFEHEENPNWNHFMYKVTPQGDEEISEYIKDRVMWTEESISWIEN